MAAPSRRRSALALGAAVSLLASSVLADSRTEFLVQRLKADDFRVRTNAALALGATNDEGAVQPLCSALDDDSEVVRQASAVALKRLLKPASLVCLRQHRDGEKNDSVKLQISRAVEALEGSAGPSNGDKGTSDPVPGDAPRTVSGARYYVSIAPITNNTTRPQAEIDRLVGGAVRSKFEGLGEHQLAPAKEAPDAARSVMQKRKLKGFYLTLSLDKLNYTDSGLTVTVRMVIFNYPGKAMQGMLSKSASQPGLRPGDKSSEDALVTVAVQAALDGFAQNAAKF